MIWSRNYNKHQTHCIWGLCPYTDLRHGQLTGTMLTYSKGFIRTLHPQNPKHRMEIVHTPDTPVLERACSTSIEKRLTYLTRCAGLVMLLGWEIGDCQNSSFMVILQEGKGHRLNCSQNQSHNVIKLTLRVTQDLLSVSVSPQGIMSTVCGFQIMTKAQ